MPLIVSLIGWVWISISLVFLITRLPTVLSRLNERRQLFSNDEEWES